MEKMNEEALAERGLASGSLDRRVIIVLLLRLLEVTVGSIATFEFV